MGNAILDSIADLARLRRIDLRPGWADAATQIQREDEEALDLYCEAIGWAPSSSYYDNPRAHEFPLLAYHDDNGWAVAERFESGNRLRVSVNGQVLVWNEADKARLYDLVIPLPAGRRTFKNAFDVFKTAVFRRKQARQRTHVARIATRTKKAACFARRAPARNTACSTQASKMMRMTGLSITKSATTPVLRMPAMSVVVFQ